MLFDQLSQSAFKIQNVYANSAATAANDAQQN